MSENRYLEEPRSARRKRKRAQKDRARDRSREVSGRERRAAPRERAPAPRQPAPQESPSKAPSDAPEGPRTIAHGGTNPDGAFPRAKPAQLRARTAQYDLRAGRRGGRGRARRGVRAAGVPHLRHVDEPDADRRQHRRFREGDRLKTGRPRCILLRKQGSGQAVHRGARTVGRHRRQRQRVRRRRTARRAVFKRKGARRMRYRAAVPGAGRPDLCDGRPPLHLGGLSQYLGGMHFRRTADRQDRVPSLAAARIRAGKLGRLVKQHENK